jgi:hypothetical protein
MKQLLFGLTTVVLITVLVVASCKDSTKAQFNALGKPHIITLLGCTGDTLRRWESTGSVSNEEESDGWYFEDAATGKLVEVTGTLVIEVK